MPPSPKSEPDQVGNGFPQGTVFRAALDPVVIIEANGTVRDWNPAAVEVFGYSWEEAVGRELAEMIIPGPMRDSHRRALERYIETGESTILDRRVELTAIRRDGTEFPIELSVTRLSDADELLFAGFIRDLGERNIAQRENARLQARMTFLAQAGLVLESSLDFNETLSHLAQLPVPDLAPLAVVDLLEDDSSIRTAVCASEDPEAARLIEQTRRREPISLAGTHPVAQVLRSGKPMLLQITPDEHEQIAQGPEHLELMRRLRYCSAVVVPLIARRRVLGALSLLRIGDAEPFDGGDLVLAEEIGRRAALAVDNARLYENTRHIARTLQESLLPRSLPEIPGVRITGRYLAAAQGQQVGGDFYDVFPIGERTWGIAIGDVCGKGPEAAALTSLARYTIRALAGQEPATVLAMLNDALMRDLTLLPERFMTALFAIASLDDGRLSLEVASAGHPAPVVLRGDGSVERVAVGGALLGMSTGIEYSSERIMLEPGDSVVLYTDGLTDARAPAQIMSEAEVEQIVASGHQLGSAALAELLEIRATAGQEPRDDIALLVIECAHASEQPGGAGVGTLLRSA